MNVDRVNGENIRVGDILGVPNGDGLYVVGSVGYDAIYVEKDYNGIVHTIQLPKINTRYYRLKNI